MLTQLNDGTNKVANNLVVLGLKTKENNTKASVKYLVHMQLKASSGNSVKHSVAFIQSLPGGGSDKANPYVLENRNVYLEGMVSETHGREPEAVSYVPHTNQQVIVHLTADDEDNDFVIGKRVRYGAHSALVNIDGGLQIELKADDKIYQNQNLVGKVKTTAAAGSLSFEMIDVNYANVDDSPLWVENDPEKALSGATVTNQFTGSQGVITDKSGKEITINSVEGNFEGNFDFFVQNDAGKYVKVEDVRDKTVSTQLVGDNELVNEKMVACHVNTSGTKPYEIGNFDADANGPKKYLSGVLVRQPDSEISAFDDQLFLQASDASKSVAQLLNARDTSVYTASIPASLPAVSDIVSSSTATIQIEGTFDAGDSVTILDDGQQILHYDVTATQTAAEVATTLKLEIGIKQQLEQQGQLEESYPYGIVDEGTETQVVITKNSAMNLTASATNAGCEVRVTDEIVQFAADEQEELLAQVTISLETTPAYQAGEVISVTFTKAGDQHTASYTVLETDDTMEKVENGLMDALEGLDVLDNVEKVGTNTYLLEAAAELTVGAITRDGAQQTHLDVTNTHLPQVPSPGAVEIFSSPENIERTVQAPSYAFMVGDTVTVSYTKSGLGSGKKSITFDAADKPRVIEAEKGEFWATFKLAEEIRNLGFYAYVDSNKLTIVHEDASDSLEIVLNSGYAQLFRHGIYLKDVSVENNTAQYTIESSPIYVEQLLKNADPKPTTATLTLQNEDKWGTKSAGVDLALTDQSTTAVGITPLMTINGVEVAGATSTTKAITYPNFPNLPYNATQSNHTYNATFKLSVNGVEASYYLNRTKNYNYYTNVLKTSDAKLLDKQQLHRYI